MLKMKSLEKTVTNNFQRAVCASFILLSLVGCREYESLIADAREAKLKHNEARVFDGELEPPFPKASENDRTLEGVDVNNNGVRDDVEIWINYVGSDSNHRRALKQLSKSALKMLQNAGADSNTCDKIASEFWDALKCANNFEKLIPNIKDYPSIQIDYLMFNTRERVKSLEKFNGHSRVYKNSSKVQNGSDVKNLCSFDVE